MASIIGVIGLLAVAALSVLEARAEEGMWRRCRGIESLLSIQRQISAGKARIR